MAKKLFNKDEEFMDEYVDEINIDEDDLGSKTADKKSQASKVLVPVIIAGIIAVLLGIAGFGFSAYQNVRLQKEFDKAVTDYISSGEVNMTAKIEEAIDAYAKENQPTNLTDLVGEEGARELMDSILTDLSSAELTENQKDQLKEILVDLFSKDGALTVSGKAVFNEESKEYLTKLITEEMGKTLVKYYGEGSDVEGLVKKYDALESSIKKIISEQTGSANISYSLTDNDRENIKKAVISSLGDLKGKDGATGKTGRAGKDGADGRDGKTPVKGIDYFTDMELDLFVKTVEHNVKDYFDVHELDEIAAMTDSIKADVLEIFNKSADTLGDDLKVQEREISSIGSAIGTETSGDSESSNVFNRESIYKKGDIIVRGGRIYQCIEDMAQPGEWNESQWEETDLVAVNNYYNSLISEKENEITTGYTSLVGSLETKIEALVNKVVSGLTQSIEDTNSQTNERLESLASDTNSKLDGLENSAESRMDAMESDTNSRFDSMQSDTENKLDTMRNDTDSRFDSMKSDTDQKLGDLQADTNGRIEELGNTVEEKITNLSSSVNTVIQNFKDWASEKLSGLDSRIDDVEAMQTTYELIDNGDGTYTLKITDPKTLN